MSNMGREDASGVTGVCVRRLADGVWSGLLSGTGNVSRILSSMDLTADSAATYTAVATALSSFEAAMAAETTAAAVSMAAFLADDDAWRLSASDWTSNSWMHCSFSLSWALARVSGSQLTFLRLGAFLGDSGLARKGWPGERASAAHSGRGSSKLLPEWPGNGVAEGPGSWAPRYLILVTCSGCCVISAVPTPLVTAIVTMVGAGGGFASPLLQE